MQRIVCSDSMHCGVERLFCPINCFCENLHWIGDPVSAEILFLTGFSRIYRLTKVDVLGTWEVHVQKFMAL